ncbi:MAG: alpha/beta hydrolase [Actinomycetota bacterium]
MSAGGEAPVEYDEFGLFAENIAEFDLDVDPHHLPPVERLDTSIPWTDRHVSALRWGSGPVERVFLHGGAQNAHTWDTVILALDTPALAVDLPGHGHSSWRDDAGYNPMNMADDVAEMVMAFAPQASQVVGMSLGGLTAMELAVRHPNLVRSLVMVDITPSVNGEKTKAITDFVNGPQSFQRFDDLLARTIEHNPTRSESSLRRGILHNAHQLDDGSWQWRYDRGGRRPVGEADATPRAVDVPDMWTHFESVSCPLTLVRGATSPVVDDDDVAEARRRQPEITVHVVEGAGHSVQGDRPVELARLL